MNFTPGGRGESWGPLIEGAIEHEAYALPGPVRDAVEVRERLWAFRPAEIPADSSLVDQLLDAARNGKTIPGTDLPTLDAVALATSRQQARNQILHALHDARERAGWALKGTIAEHADEQLELLRQALDECLADARTLISTIGQHGLMDPFRGPDSVMKARARFRPVAARYVRIRTGRRVLARYLPPPRLDVDGEFAEMANAAEFVGTPWNETDGPDARLFELLRRGAQLWMPTPAEMDDAYKAAHPRSTRIPATPAMMASG